MGSDRTIENYLARVTRLQAEHRHAEACDLLKQSLEAIGSDAGELRAMLLVRLSLACFRAGRNEDAVHWAEAALPLTGDLALRMNAHSSAGVALSTLNRLDGSEAHREEALRLAREIGDRPAEARNLSGLATVQLRRGKLSESIAAAEASVELTPSGVRLARMVQADAFRVAGDHQRARAAYQEARSAAGRGAATAEARSQALLALSEAWNELDAGDAAAALERLMEAAPLEAEPKLGPGLRATRARAVAMAGDSGAARELAEAVSDERDSLIGEGDSLRTVDSMLGHTAFLLGDWKASARYWQAYLDADPSPAFRIDGLYYRGMALLRLGDREGALASLREVVDLGLATASTRRAREVLGTLVAGGTCLSE